MRLDSNLVRAIGYEGLSVALRWDTFRVGVRSQRNLGDVLQQTDEHEGHLVVRELA